MMSKLWTRTHAETQNSTSTDNKGRLKSSARKPINTQINK